MWSLGIFFGRAIDFLHPFQSIQLEDFFSRPALVTGSACENFNDPLTLFPPCISAFQMV